MELSMAPTTSSFSYFFSLSFFFTITVATFISLFLFRAKTRFKNLPPSPPTLPIIGNLHYLRPRLHRSFLSLSKTYGHIFSLWFGSRLVIVISSPSLYQECFTKHDAVLANRPRFLTGKHLFYDHTSLTFSSAGDRWRDLRRIIITDVLSAPRLSSFTGTRREETLRLMRKLVEDTSCCGGEGEFKRVQLRPRLVEMLFNNMMGMISGGTKVIRYDGGDDCGLAKTIEEIMRLVNAVTKRDFLPLLRWIDLNNWFEKRLKRVGERADALLQALLDDHRNGVDGCPEDAMIQHLLTLQKSQPTYYSDQVIKGLIQDLLLGGTNTTSLTIEWAMSALLNHPEILEKAKDELDAQVGNDRLMDESDIPNLPYLQNIMNETLRLYSPSPLLLPHYSSQEFNIGGFTIPRGSIVLINAWAIRTDPEIWSDDAKYFKPERFQKAGEANKLLAFGLGRRACPGVALAYRTMALSLGLLIQCFEWKPLTYQKIDMMEDTGFTMRKQIPFEAMCKPRPISTKIME